MPQGLHSPRCRPPACRHLAPGGRCAGQGQPRLVPPPAHPRGEEAPGEGQARAGLDWARPQRDPHLPDLHLPYHLHAYSAPASGFASASFLQLKHRPAHLYSDFHAKALLGPQLDLSEAAVAKMEAAAGAFSEVSDSSAASGGDPLSCILPHTRLLALVAPGSHPSLLNCRRRRPGAPVT